jgi:hypothetical protein
MFGQAAELAVLGALYPPAILIAALFLVSERPGRHAVLYLLGGLLMVTVIGTTVLIVIRTTGLSLPSHHQSRYGLRLGLGVAALIGAVIVYRRPAKPAKPDKQKKPGLVARMTSRPTARTAFAVGVLVFGPSVTFIAAVQVVATAKASLAATIGALAMIAIITVAFAWLPLVAYLIAPDATIRTLNKMTEWLGRNRQTVLAVVLAVVGIVLVVQGATGLS